MAASLLRLTKGMSMQKFHLLRRTLDQSITVLVSCNRLFHLPNPFSSRYNFRPLDGVPSKYELVYRSSLNNYIVYVYVPCIVPGLLSLAIIGSKLWNGIIPEPYVTSETFGMLMFDGTWQVVAASPILTLFAAVVLLVANRCVLRIYFEEEERKFIAVRSTMLPWQVRKLTFDAGQMRWLCMPDDPSSVTRTIRGEYALGLQRLIIFPHNFKLPYHYNVMMGYAS